MNEKAYVLCTTAGGVDVFFTGLKDGKPNFIDDVKKSMFMNEKDALKLEELLTRKTNLAYEVMEVSFEDEV